MKILEVKDGWFRERGNEVENRAGGLSVGLVQALGEGPCIDRNIQSLTDIAQDISSALLFGRKEISERSPGLEGFPEQLGCARFGERNCRVGGLGRRNLPFSPISDSNCRGPSRNTISATIMDRQFA